MNKRKLLQKIINNSKNVRFDDIVTIANSFGFILARTDGSHNIFKHSDVSEIVNLQNVNGKAKPYQIKQLLALVEKYNLKLEEKE